jgi:hypothetical protein
MTKNGQTSASRPQTFEESLGPAMATAQENRSATRKR